MIEKYWKKYGEVILYLFFGVLTTVVNWAAYAVSVKIGISLFISNALAWALAVLFAFVTNKIFVFKSKSAGVKELISEIVKFLGARIATGVIEIVGVPLLYQMGLQVTVMGVEGLAAKMLVSVVVVILNYVFSKLFIFKGKES